MTALREAAQQALEALEDHAKQYPHMQKGYTVDAITALRTALAEQAEQEPVAWRYKKEGAGWFVSDNEPQYVEQWNDIEEIQPLYTAPQPAKQPLTTEEIYECERIAAIRHHRHKNSIRGQQLTPADDPQWHFANAIIAAYERKNGIGEQP